MKIKSVSIASLFALVIASCNNAGDPSKNNNTAAAQEVKTIPVHLMDSVEHFFGNENWQVIDGRDTSYILFSRQNEYYIKLYNYKMAHGDSVNNSISAISFKGDSVTWLQSGQQLFLKNISGNTITWGKSNPSDTNLVLYKKIAATKIILQQGRQPIQLTRTITLSDFLVRSRYDFLNGTKLAFKDTSFTVKHGR